MFAGKNLKWHKKASHPDSIKKNKKKKQKDLTPYIKNKCVNGH